MDANEFVAIGASIVAALSVLASVFSAIGAARSADIAKSVEDRLRAAERESAERELKRTHAAIKSTHLAIDNLLDNMVRETRITAVMMGPGVGNRLKLEEEEIEKRRNAAKVLEEQASVPEDTAPLNARELAALQIALDHSLIWMRTLLDLTARDLSSIRENRQVMNSPTLSAAVHRMF